MADTKTKHDRVYGGDCDKALADRIDRRMRGQLSAEDRAELKKWHQAKAYEQILDLNRAFLRGEAELCPYYMGPVYAETTPFLPALLRLHDYGILTTNSQPAKVTGPEYDECNCCPKWSWFWNKQRPFLSFMVPMSTESLPETKVSRFINELMFAPEFYTSIFNGIRVFDNFPGKWETNISKRADSKADFESNPEVVHRQIIKLDDDRAVVPFTTETGVMLKANPLLVQVLARSWEEQDLVGLVDKAAERAGMQRVYAV